MNIFTHFENLIKQSVEQAGFSSETPLDLSKISVEPPRDPSHGDLATNVAMILTKQVKMPPRDVAAKIADALMADEAIDTVEIAGPGFINLRLTPVFWTSHIAEILKQGERYGAGLIGNNLPVNVEYVSANPTGPMHVGHCRGAVVGDVMANLLSFAGFDVTKEYYINDAGVQIGVLARSVHLRYREALGEDIGDIPEGLYPGDYLIPVAKALVDEFGDKLLSMEEAEWEPLIRDRTIDAMMDLIRDDLAALNVRHDIFFSERTLHEKGEGGKSKIDAMLEEMRDREFVYDGSLPPPKGEVPDDWEDREQTLFKSTQVGDDMDRPLIKSDGSYTYFAADVAYFKEKFDRGYQRMIFVLGADHGGYVKRLKAVARAISNDSVQLDVLLCNLVKLFRDGEPVRMSKRAGNFVTLREVVDEVGKDAVRFMMLYRKAEAEVDFDFAKVTEQSRDNPVFYVQYAHARVQAVFRKAKEECPDLDISLQALENADFTLLHDEGEIALIRKLAAYPRLIEQATNSDEPHRLAFYLYELASELHSHWNKGKESPELRFINYKNAQLTLTRLALLRSVAFIIASGLSILGVDAPEEMR